jgi:XapX domain-containing protein
MPPLKVALAFALSFSIGAACRYFDIPNPAPGAVFGALLVLTMTVGYVVVGHFLPQ